MPSGPVMYALGPIMVYAWDPARCTLGPYEGALRVSLGTRKSLVKKFIVLHSWFLLNLSVTLQISGNNQNDRVHKILVHAHTLQTMSEVSENFRTKISREDTDSGVPTL